MLVLILMVPCYKWRRLTQRPYAQGHISKKGSSSSFDSSRNVSGSASYFLEPQVKAYFLPGASVFLSMK